VEPFGARGIGLLPLLVHGVKNAIFFAGGDVVDSDADFAVEIEGTAPAGAFSSLEQGHMAVSGIRNGGGAGADFERTGLFVVFERGFVLAKIPA
jgi:hypothetical protein